MTLQDLAMFCSLDETRKHLAKPITDDEWTYATDGRIAIRVPAIGPKDDPLDKDRAYALNTLRQYFGGELLRTQYGDYSTIPPEPKEGWGDPCKTCDGKGTTCRVMCQDCGSYTVLPVEIECLDCYGCGKVYWDKRVSFGKIDLNAFYIGKILKLKNPLIAFGESSEFPAKFKFDGGEGILMCMKPK